MYDINFSAIVIPYRKPCHKLPLFSAFYLFHSFNMVTNIDRAVYKTYI